MGILDGVEHTFSAVINDVEHWAGDVETLVAHASSEVETIGIAITGDISWLIEYLIKIGEDPVHFLSTLQAHITSIGGEVMSTLGTLVHGVMTYGLIEFLKMQVEKALSPVKDTLQQHTARGQAVADVHHTTLNTMQTKLNLLTASGNPSDIVWQGQSVDAMNGSFANISTFINQLSDQIQHDGTQARINQAFITVLEGIGIIAAGLAILDIFIALASAVVAIAVPGIGTLAAAGIDAAIIATQLEFLLALVALDAGVWLIATLAIYILHHPITPGRPPAPTPPHNGSQITTNPTVAGDLPKGDIKNDTDRVRRKYIPPKNSRGHVTRDPHGGGFIDDKGNVWKWAEDKHGGEHWDVTHPDESHTNVDTDGDVIGEDRFPNNDSAVPPGKK